MTVMIIVHVSIIVYTVCYCGYHITLSSSALGWYACRAPCKLAQPPFSRKVHRVRPPLQNHHARHRRGRTQTRETAKEPVRQHQGLDGDDLPRPPVDGCQQNSLDEDVCFFCPQVLPTTAKVERLSEWVIEQCRSRSTFCFFHQKYVLQKQLGPN